MYNNSSILESWTTLAALSSITKTIRLGTMASCNSFRNPSLLAKMAATLDVISNGRLELGIGAGVQESEHLAYGMPFPKSKERIMRLNEAVEVIKKMWTEEKASYTGKFYQVKDAACFPKPVQKPHPPITIAGGGEKLTLKVTAKHADRFDWGYLPSMTAFKHKLAVLRQTCRVINRNFQEIEKSCWPASQIIVQKSTASNGSETSAPGFKGAPQELANLLQRYRDLGVTFFMLFFGDLPKVKSLRAFAEAVFK
jgi:alkanesulfonate monooxygenase SsuD/methylene tetrahydromethanopterin reductase-like flavin-dependent oxidoreductase (luciferase family)